MKKGNTMSKDKYGINIKRSFFYKIFIMLAIIMILFCVALIVAGQTSLRNIRRERNNIAYSELLYFKRDFENEINRIESLQKQYINDNDVFLLSNIVDLKSNYEVYTAVKRLHEKLVIFQQSSNYIEKVSIHIPLIGKTISNEYYLRDINYDEIDYFMQISSYDYNPIIYHNDEYYLSYPYYMGVNSKANFIHLILIKLSKDAMLDSLKKIARFDDNIIALLNIENDWCMGIYDDLDKSKLINISYENNTTSLFNRISVGENDYIYSGDFSNYLQIHFMYLVNEDELMYPFKQYRILLISVIVVVFLLTGLFSVRLYRTINIPIGKLIYAFKKVREGDFSVSINHESHDEFEYVFKSYNEMVKKIDDLIENVYKKEILLKEAMFKQLQYKINPHMLYNSLYFIYRIAKAEDNEEIASFTKVIADYYMFINKHASEEICLLDEINHCKNYMKIQSIRFNDKVKTILDYDEEVISQITVPSLIVQPLLENAYKYAFNNSNQKAFVKLSIEKKNTLLTIKIIDNGTGMPEDELLKLQSRINDNIIKDDKGSILNIHHRLKIKYGGCRDVSVQNLLPEGFMVSIIINTSENDNV